MKEVEARSICLFPQAGALAPRPSFEKPVLSGGARAPQTSRGPTLRRREGRSPRRRRAADATRARSRVSRGPGGSPERAPGLRELSLAPARPQPTLRRKLCRRRRWRPGSRPETLPRREPSPRAPEPRVTGPAGSGWAAPPPPPAPPAPTLPAPPRARAADRACAARPSPWWPWRAAPPARDGRLLSGAAAVGPKRAGG